MAKYIYDNMQVCRNGHKITGIYRRRSINRKDFCDECGAPTIHECLDCGKPIRGNRLLINDFERVVSILEINVPLNCEYCGKPFPWKERISIKSDLSRTPEIKDEKILQLLKRFHIIYKQIIIRHDNRMSIEINDEYDVQDFLHALLKIYVDDIRPEEWTPSYAGKSKRMDLLLKKEKIVIEMKYARKTNHSKLPEELIIDIAHYKEHSDCKQLICFIYDPEDVISNKASYFDLEKQSTNNFSIKLIFSP